MRIIADDNIPLLQEYFGPLGHVDMLPGRSITAHCLKGVDALLVRSVTPVNEALLHGSKLQFVGTATAGVDHIDQHYLANRDVTFASAAGCNATAVSEYVLCALYVLAERYRFRLSDRTLGIVGKGRIGSRLFQMLTGLGLQVQVCDPFCQQAGDNSIAYVSLDQLIQQCDVISLHTPLTTTGPFPTYHLINQSHLAAMQPGTVLINTARGAVIDNQALKQCLVQGQDLQVVLDVWEHEPAIDLALLQRVALASPHIAGYSLDGKVAGTRMLCQAFCQHFNLPAPQPIPPLIPLPDLAALTFNSNVQPDTTCSQAMRAVYDIQRDDAWLRQLLTMQPIEAKQTFDQLRQSYPIRREFHTLTVKLQRDYQQTRHMLHVFGFKTAIDNS